MTKRDKLFATAVAVHLVSIGGAAVAVLSGQPSLAVDLVMPGTVIVWGLAWLMARV